MKLTDDISVMASGKIIRQAVCEDIDQLVDICRQSFPRTIRWRIGGKSARCWWRIAISSRSTQVWILEEYRRINGFCVFVIDEQLWQQEKAFRNGNKAIYFLSALQHPLVACDCIYNRCYHILTNTKKTIIHQSLPHGWGPSMRTWSELIAVRPERRGAGLGGLLLEQCELITAKMGRWAIAMRVLSDNISAKALYQKCGFDCYSSDNKGDLYAKILKQ